MIAVKHILFIALIAAFAQNVLGQANNDYNWILGYPPNRPEIYYGGVSFNFNSNSPPPTYFETKCNALYSAILSSNSGRLLAYSNGCSIFNSDQQYMEEGDTIASGYIWDNYCEDIGYPGNHNHIFLPWPGDTSKAILIYCRVSQDHSVYNYLYAILQFNAEHPLGIVTEKDRNLLISGTTGFLTATKHGNGRDWWLIIPEHNSNRFFISLLQPGGITVVDTQSIGTSWGQTNHSGQAIFSPDGTKYIRFTPWKGLDIFDFDRCSGILSNPIESGPFSNPVITAGGVACSIDSRYLYVSNSTKLFQFDLANADILSTKTLIGQYDGFTNPFATNFYHMALAPNGKIFIFSSNGVRDLSIINYPRLKGDSCGFIQHGVHLPAFVLFGSPNLPFFRLGPLDGSYCDTLGINNRPIADFRYKIDSLDQHKVSFTNLSYFNPKLYYWTFGDNATSEAVNPLPHTFTGDQSYQVCLTAWNEYGLNTFCRAIDFDSSTSIDDSNNENKIIVYPNPASDYFTIKAPAALRSIDIYNVTGNLVYTQNNGGSEFMEIDARTFSSGLYLIVVKGKVGSVFMDKILIFK